MTKRLLAVFVAAALPLVALVPPAVAADTLVPVEGHAGLDAEPSLMPWTNKCGQPHVEGNQTPTKLVHAGGTAGGEALGWDFTESGNEAGALLYRADNTTVSYTSVDVLGMGDTISGHAIALFDYWDDFGFGYYVGVGNQFSFPVDGWQTLSHAQNGTPSTYNWYRVDSNFDKVPGSEKVATIAQMRDWQNAPSGVYTGFVMGCNTQSFYLDKLRVVLGADTLTYDFETPQIHSMAHVEYSRDGKTVRNGNLTVNLGAGVRVLGHAHGHQDATYFNGFGALWAQPYGKAWRRVATGFYDPDYYATFAQRPDHRTVYYFTTGADSVHSAADSEYMVVNVRGRVSAKIFDRTLIEGQRITAIGQIRPRNAGQKLRLQRRVNGTWKTIARGTTNREGEYRFGTVASSPGTWRVRVLMESGNGNLGNRSRVIDVTVKKYVPPPPKEGDGVSEPPPVVVPQTPVPATPEPDRDTPSGRILLRTVPTPPAVGQKPAQ